MRGSEAPACPRRSFAFSAPFQRVFGDFAARQGPMRLSGQNKARTPTRVLLRFGLRRCLRVSFVEHGRWPVVGRHAVIVGRIFRGRMVTGSGIVRAAAQGRRKAGNQQKAIHRLSKGNKTTSDARRVYPQSMPHRRNACISPAWRACARVPCVFFRGLTYYVCMAAVVKGGCHEC